MAQAHKEAHKGSECGHSLSSSASVIGGAHRRRDPLESRGVGRTSTLFDRSPCPCSALPHTSESASSSSPVLSQTEALSSPGATPGHDTCSTFQHVHTLHPAAELRLRSHHDHVPHWQPGPVSAGRRP
eukprot:888105-Rhodomonas_salina.2